MAACDPSKIPDSEKTKIIEDAMETVSKLYPSLAYFLASLEIRRVGVENNVKIAATDGSTLLIGPCFYCIQRPQRLFAIIHEVYHAFLLHSFRFDYRNHEIWNAATDLVINSEIIREMKGSFMREGVTAKGIPGTLYSKEITPEKYSAETTYDRLTMGEPIQLSTIADAGPKIPEGCWPKEKGGQGHGPFGIIGPFGPKPIIKEGLPPNNQPLEKQPQTEPPRKNPPENPFNSDLKPGDPAKLPDIMERIESSLNHGSLPVGLRKLAEDAIKPKIQWKPILRQYMNKIFWTEYSMIPPNKRYMYIPKYFPNAFESGVEVLPLPTLRTKETTIAVAIDTSGSINDYNYLRFWKGFRSILPSPTDVRGVVLFQSAAQTPVVFRWPSIPSTQTLNANVRTGKADFVPVFTWIERNMRNQIDLLVYLTDGEGTYPERRPHYPVLWLLTKDYKVPFGTKIIIGRD